MGKRVLLGIFFFSLLMICTEAFGDGTFRCGHKVIALEDEKSDVLSECGEPDHRETWEEEVYSKTTDTEEYQGGQKQTSIPAVVKATVRMERWTYDLGAQRFKRYLVFKNDKLIDIKTGKKGSN